MVENTTDEMSKLTDAPENFLFALKQIVPDKFDLKAKLARFEELTGISASNHLAFGDIDNNLKQQLKTIESLNETYYGEVNSENKRTGRGICIQTNGTIWIACWAN